MPPAAAVLLVFCGNIHRQRRLHDWRGRPFANDYLNAFFNAAVDAAIALCAFVTAAEVLGLGCCPLSAIRNQADAVSELYQSVKIMPHRDGISALLKRAASSSHPFSVDQGAWTMPSPASSRAVLGASEARSAVASS